MTKKHDGGPAPVPPENLPKMGPATGPGANDVADPTDDGAAFQEQDPKRRLGGYTTAGEHARQQPGPLNDG